MSSMEKMLELNVLYSRWAQRWTARNQRIGEIRGVLDGALNQLSYEGDVTKSRAQNFILDALQDTVDAASVVPSVRVEPSKNNKSRSAMAEKMEMVLTGYLASSGFDQSLRTSVLDLLSTGMCVWTVEPDDDAVIRVFRRDPIQVYPEPGWRPGDAPKSAFIARSLYVTQLPAQYRAKLGAAWPSLQRLLNGEALSAAGFNDFKVDVVDWFDETERVLFVTAERQGSTRRAGAVPAGFDASTLSLGGDGVAGSVSAEHGWNVMLDRWDNLTGLCPVVIAQQPSWDGEPHGQYDHVIPLQETFVELQGMLLDNAEDSVYAPYVASGLIGDVNLGANAVNEVVEGGSLERISPARSSFDIHANLSNLSEQIRTSMRWPRARSGDVDQNIISGKGIEALSGHMGTHIRGVHTSLRLAVQQLLTVASRMDVALHGDMGKVASGVWRNQTFGVEYTPSKDIDLEAYISVDYGPNLGRDPESSHVMSLQMHERGLLSRQSLMESVPGVTDPQKEVRKIETEALERLIQAKMAEGLQTGEVSLPMLVDLLRSVEQGNKLVDAFDDVVVQPLAEQEAALLEGLVPTGLPEGPVQLGGAAAAPPQPGVGAPPPPPSSAVGGV